MKTLKNLSVIIALAAMFFMTSCLGKDNKGYTVTSNFTNLFNAVVTNDGAITLYPNQSVKVDWQYTEEMTATLQIIGLQLPTLGAFPALQFNDKPWKLNGKGWQEISMTDVKADASAGYMSDITFNRFSLQTINRSYNNLVFPPCLYISYVINNEYRVYTLPMEIIEVGNTVVTETSTGSSFTQSDTSRSIYYIELDPATRKGYVVIQGAQFAQNMPGLNMKFPDIPFEVTPTGTIMMNADEITPALMTSSTNIKDPGTPAPNYPITNFRASYIGDYGVTISFNCTPHTKDGKPMGTYTVNFKCEYPTSANQSTIQ